MTDFLQWWADHWPLVPVLVMLVVWYNLQFYWLFQAVRAMLRDARRREP